MALKVPLEGLEWLLNKLKDNWGNLTLHLYSNDKTPTDADIVDDYTEASFSGYAEVSINAWADAVKNTDNIHWQVQGTAITFTHNGGGQTTNCYGYYVTALKGLSAGAVALLWAERFSNPPVAMAVLGDFITVVPVLQDRTEY